MASENMYDDGPPGTPSEPDQPEGGESEESDSQTTLLPKSVIGGETRNPGDTIELQVVADHGDEYEVKAVESKPSEKPEQPAAGGGDAGGGGMASMLSD